MIGLGVVSGRGIDLGRGSHDARPRSWIAILFNYATGSLQGGTSEGRESTQSGPAHVENRGCLSDETDHIAGLVIAVNHQRHVEVVTDVTDEHILRSGLPHAAPASPWGTCERLPGPFQGPPSNPSIRWNRSKILASSGTRPSPFCRRLVKLASSPQAARGSETPRPGRCPLYPGSRACLGRCRPWESRSTGPTLVGSGGPRSPVTSPRGPRRGRSRCTGRRRSGGNGSPGCSCRA